MESSKVTRFIVLPAVVLSLLVIAVIVILYTATGGKIQPNYGIVVDAGSSKTAITLYSWPGEKDRATGVVKQEMTDKVNQPMAKFENITKFGDILLPFIAQQTKEIMSGRVKYTRLYLAATAGMRALNLTDPEKAAILLNTTEATLKEKTSLIIEEVAIMSETLEALNAWIAVNYLMDRLRDQQKGEAIGILDMGGASAQIAYLSPSKKDIDIKLYGIDYNVKTISDLCFGVDEAGIRLVAMLIKEKSSSQIVDPCTPKDGPERKFKGEELLKRGCLDGAIKDNIDPSTEYVFTGGSDYTKCSSVVNKLLDLKECKKNFDICFEENEPISEKQQFLAISSYFYNSRVLNLTDDTIDKTEFGKQTKFICSLDYNSTLSEPKVVTKFASDYCFRLNYIYSILTRVYRFEGNWTNIVYKNNVNGNDVGWSLGLMINATNAIPAELPSKQLIATTPFIILFIVFSLIVIPGLVYLIKNKYFEA